MVACTPSEEIFQFKTFKSFKPVKPPPVSSPASRRGGGVKEV
jgi:hypothetical protein